MIENAWYTAGWSHELGSDEPLGRKLLGSHVVLFRDRRGAAHALDAVCPHRGANLAGGRVVGGEIQCPFHGWRFDAAGECARIPSQPPSAKIPKQARVRRYHLVEQQGVLWIWGGDDEPSEPAPRYDFWSSERARRHFAEPMLWNAGFVHVAEQSIDNTHTPFVHAGSLGPEQQHETVRFAAEVDPDGRGFEWLDPTPPPTGKGFLKGVIQRRLLGIDPIRRRFRFELGGTAYLKVDHSTGDWDVTVFGMTPADDDSTWFFAETVRTHSLDAVSDLMHRRWFAEVIAEDMRIAQLILRQETGEQLPEVSVAADAVTLTFRRLYSRWLNAERMPPDTRQDAASRRTKAG